MEVVKLYSIKQTQKRVQKATAGILRDWEAFIMLLLLLSLYENCHKQ
jgi:hypothetical protein